MKPIRRVSLYCLGIQNVPRLSHPSARCHGGTSRMAFDGPGARAFDLFPALPPPANWRQTLVEVSFVFAATAAAASEISITLSDEEKRGAVSTRSLARSAASSAAYKVSHPETEAASRLLARGLSFSLRLINLDDICSQKLHQVHSARLRQTWPS